MGKGECPNLWKNKNFWGKSFLTHVGGVRKVRANVEGRNGQETMEIWTTKTSAKWMILAKDERLENDFCRRSRRFE
jgi:hypothetical protein